VARALPFLAAKFPTHEAYAKASVEEVLGERAVAAKVLEAVWLESTVFLNRGTSFVARPLPVIAQAAPAFGICVADFDGDGNEDIFLAQNFFAVQAEMPRLDAGLGLWLRGNGRGDFTALSAAESGVRIFGEQRGAALADYDGDGRVDLLVGQNGQQTKLFHNSGARPGLRVRLVGPSQNPNAIGAVLRLSDRAGAGAAREVQAGSGYWSQNSAVQVMSAAARAAQLSVRWPGGGVTNLNVQADAREITVTRGDGGNPR
jgi:enediyne biosynthesis protein E4